MRSSIEEAPGAGSALLAALSAALLAAGCGGGGAGVAAPEGGPRGTAEEARDAGADAGASASASIADPLSAAGRALEAGDAESAAKLLAAAPDGLEARWLGARIAEARGYLEEAIRQYRVLAGARPDLERRRRAALARALARAGRYGQAIDEARSLLESEIEMEPAERVLLAERVASWLASDGRPAEAAHALEDLRHRVGADRIRDRMDLARAEALAAAGDPDGAVALLAPLARSAASADLMRRAETALRDLGRPVEWSDRERIARAERFFDRKAWDDALEMLAPLIEAGNGEARWLEARILYRRRRHWDEAVEALDLLIEGGGDRADEARFLRARALSRLDRDDEAIVAYREFARRTGRKGKAAEARFLAARLEFYLGRHGRALASFEKLVGEGSLAKKKGRGGSASKLDPGRRRDAHFLAGMCALLDGKPRRAAPHFSSASEGSGSAEAISRNGYWLAVARNTAGERDGPKLLRAVCEPDPTSWYALLARRRLEDASEEPGPCGSAIPIGPDGGATDAGGDASPDAGADGTIGPDDLEGLSPLAAFLARAGLYRDAAKELADAEEEGRAGADQRRWLEAYLLVDAPHLAIRRASRGLGWPPDDGDEWRARAAYPTPYDEIVREEERRRGLPRDLLYAIARKESLFEPGAVSGAGALGMMQMMPRTFERNRECAGAPPLGEGEIPGPETSIRAAACELARLLERFDGSLPLAIMAYNGGPGAVSRWVERSGDSPIDVFVEKAGFAQTRNYVRRVWRNLVRYRLIAGEAAPDLPRVVERPRERPDAGAR